MNQNHEDENFGSIFYDTLQEANAEYALPQFFKYATIQKIKSSSKDELIKMLNNFFFGELMVKRLKKFSPQEFAFYFIGLSDLKPFIRGANVYTV